MEIKQVLHVEIKRRVRLSLPVLFVILKSLTFSRYVAVLPQDFPIKSSPEENMISLEGILMYASRLPPTNIHIIRSGMLF